MIIVMCFIGVYLSPQFMKSCVTEMTNTTSGHYACTTWYTQLELLHSGSHVPLLDPTANHLLCLSCHLREDTHTHIPTHKRKETMRKRPPLLTTGLKNGHV